MSRSYAPELRQVMTEAGITRADAATLLHVSVETVHAWLKPEGARGHNRCARWAPELLAYKTGLIPPASRRGGKETAAQTRLRGASAAVCPTG